MVGPNCLGVINNTPAIAMNATFAPARPPTGSVGFVSQSGAMGASVLDYAEQGRCERQRPDRVLV
jgi:acyl-CoA synthetase (NDP forming)